MVKNRCRRGGEGLDEAGILKVILKTILRDYRRKEKAMRMNRGGGREMERAIHRIPTAVILVGIKYDFIITLAHKRLQ